MKKMLVVPKSSRHTKRSNGGRVPSQMIYSAMRWARRASVRSVVSNGLSLYTAVLDCQRKNKRCVKQCWHAERKNKYEGFGPFARRLTRKKRRD
jgi:hypothetical protein